MTMRTTRMRTMWTMRAKRRRRRKRKRKWTCTMRISPLPLILVRVLASSSQVAINHLLHPHHFRLPLLPRSLPPTLRPVEPSKLS
jgi:hypothetical protein